MALSKKQRRALRAAKKDGITRSESARLKDLGIPRRLAAATDKGKDKEKVDYLDLAWDAESQSINAKYLNKLSDDEKIKLALKVRKPDDRLNGLDAAAAADAEETPVAQAPPAPVIPEYQGRGSGVYTDIVQSLGVDIDAGFDAAKELKKRGIEETDRRYDDLLEGLKAYTESGSGFDNTNLLTKRRKGDGGNTVSKKEWNKLYPANGEVFPGSGNTISRKAWKSMYPEGGDLFDSNAGKGPNLVKATATSSLSPFGLPKLTTRQVREQNPYVVAPNKNTKYTGPGSEKEPEPAEAEAAETKPQGISVADLLADQQELNNRKIEEISEAYKSQITGLELDIEGLTNAGEQWASANKFIEDQLSTANKARERAEKRASNLRNAFVPTANPNAMSVLFGDNRRGTRRQENNQLSDLSILSGLGTTSNPLAGLQLA